MPVTSKKFFLKDYALPISIGIHDSEKEAPQLVIINIEMYFEDMSLETSDEIADTVNYDFLRTDIEALAKTRHFNLQETLCHEIIKICKNVKGFKQIVVSTSKPDVYNDCDTVGYEVIYEY